MTIAADEFIHRARKARPKVRSLENIHWKSHGGYAVIHNETPRWNATSRIESRLGIPYSPGGGRVEIFDEYSRRSPRPLLVESSDDDVTREIIQNFSQLKIGISNSVEAKQNIEDSKNQTKTDNKLKPKRSIFPPISRSKYRNITAKIGSLDNIKHRPKIGNAKIHNQLPQIVAKSKIGSLDNASYKPGGGMVEILDVASSLKYLSRDPADYRAQKKRREEGKEEKEEEKGEEEAKTSVLDGVEGIGYFDIHKKRKAKKRNKVSCHMWLLTMTTFG